MSVDLVVSALLAIPLSIIGNIATGPVVQWWISRHSRKVTSQHKRLITEIERGERSLLRYGAPEVLESRAVLWSLEVIMAISICLLLFVSPLVFPEMEDKMRMILQPFFFFSSFIIMMNALVVRNARRNVVAMRMIDRNKGALDQLEFQNPELVKVDAVTA